MRSHNWPAVGAVILMLLIPVGRADVVLPGVIGDHMVLQQGRKAVIWGKASPGEAIRVRGDWQDKAVATVAGADGRWQVKLPVPAPGGPHTISVTGRNEMVLHDVLVGEVWICSGQSNMQMPVGDYGGGYSGVDHWQQELQNADFPNVRLFNVPTSYARTPQFDVNASWSPCNADTVKGFSAAGFFFGRELHKRLNVPIGLICAAVGGTPAEAWTSKDTLATLPDFAPDLKYLAADADQVKALAEERAMILSRWAAEAEAADGGPAGAAPEREDADWGSLPNPGDWTGELNNYAGYVWLRKAFDLPPNWTGRELTLELRSVDDMDFTYVNGVKVGQTVGDNTWNLPRVYKVSKTLLRPGKNVIAVRVLNTGGAGGIGSPAQIHPEGSTEAISLDHDWRYRRGAKYAELPPLRLPHEFNVDSPTGLFNAMLAPLIPFGIRGALWYQGEANVGRGEQYTRLFPAMITDWRRHWQEGDFPFYYTQIAPFHYGDPNQAGQAAALREAQRLSLKTPGTGMAVIMDSDSNNLHPKDKQKVGHRLALWARAKTYGEKGLVYTGPIYKKMKIQGPSVRLYFDGAGSGLTAEGKPLEHFEIAGADRQFVPAQAVIEGDTILVASAAVSRPVAVRYAWGDADESSFGNREGLPASSFRTDGRNF